MKPENKNMMVRGYVVAAPKSVSSVGKDEPGCLVAYTHWYRHDDNLAELERDLRLLQSVYTTFEKTATMMLGYEYREYMR